MWEAGGRGPQPHTGVLLIQHYENSFCPHSRDAEIFLASLGAELENRSGRISVTRQATHGEVESSAIISTIVTSLDLAFADQDLSNL